MVEALRAKLDAIRDQLLVAGDDEKESKETKQWMADFAQVPKEDLKAFGEVYEELGSWVDVEKDKKCFDLNLWYHLQRGLVAKALALISEKVAANTKDEKAPSKDLLHMKCTLYSGFLPKAFAFLAQQVGLDIAKQFPADYRLF